MRSDDQRTHTRLNNLSRVLNGNEFVSQDINFPEQKARFAGTAGYDTKEPYMASNMYIKERYKSY